MSEAMPETSSKGVTGLAAIRIRDFRLLLISKIFGWIALHMVMGAVPFQIYDMTRDTLNLAYIGLATFAPAFGFALFTGYVADLFDRRLVIASCYVLIVAASSMLFVISIVGFTYIWPVIVILAFMGTGRAFYQPAANSFVPNLVPPEVFPNAVAWHTSTNKIAQTAGPALGGVVYDLFGPAIVYGSASIGMAIGAAIVLFIRTRTVRSNRKPTTLQVLLAGLSYVYEKKIVFGAITLDLFAVLLGGVTILLPVYAIDILHVGAAGAGFLRSAIAAGSLATGLALTLITMERSVGRILYISVIVFGAATIVFGYSKLYWLSLAAMAVLGVADMVSVYIRVTLIQIATPDDMRGRVSAVNSVFTGASNEIGEARAGLMATIFGPIGAVVFGGVCSILVAIACWKLFPTLAKVERMDREL